MDLYKMLTGQDRPMEVTNETEIPEDSEAGQKMTRINDLDSELEDIVAKLELLKQEREFLKAQIFDHAATLFGYRNTAHLQNASKDESTMMRIRPKEMKVQLCKNKKD